MYKDLSDREIFQRFAEGDKIAFNEIYDRYWLKLFVHAQKMMNNVEMAKDVVQEVFTTLWVKIDKIEIHGELHSYLHTSVRNRIFNIIEHSKVHDHYIESMQYFFAQHAPTTENNFDIKELIKLVEAEINLLPSKMREIFELSRTEQLSHKEIAAQLNISDKTVKKQINNAIKILKRKLHLSTDLLLIIIYFCK
ncbi:RNA polymerase sigma factor [Sphingobacterium sp. LRF_L2]|uniref:RNA polymerase sigma factor n=1 Tax=Sphingobacterium sp. LRF_L2 TaxID=3369421 RepID=UPI003F639DF0